MKKENLVITVILVIVLASTTLLINQASGNKVVKGDASQSSSNDKKTDTASKGVLLGTFTGSLPCSDCSGVTTLLVLTKNDENSAEGTYELAEVRIGKSTEPVTTKGVWTTIKGTDKDPDAVVYQLNPDKPETSKYFVVASADTIRQLDDKGHEVTSGTPGVLTKSK